MSRTDSHANDVALDGASEILPLSAGSLDALVARVRHLLTELPAAACITPLRVLCGAAAAHQGGHAHRLAVVVRSYDELRQRLHEFLAAPTEAAVAPERVRGDSQRVVFTCAGQGAQWLGMGRSLLRSEPAFREVVERCSGLVEQYLGWSLLDELTAPGERSRMHLIEVSSPMLIAVEIAFAGLWRRWGIEPAAVVGYSMGEIAAAHIAGALSLEDAMRTVCAFGRIIAKHRGQGAMGVVELSWQQAEDALDGYAGRVFRAIQSAVNSTILAGEPEGLCAVLDWLTARGVFARRIVNMDAAPHCPRADSLRGDLLEALRDVRPRAAAVPIVSQVSGSYLAGELHTAAHWVRSFAEPSLFSNAIDCLLADEFRTFLEVSPNANIKYTLEENLRHSGRTGCLLFSSHRDMDEREVMLGTLGTLYEQGALVNWDAIYPLAAQ